MKVTVALVLLTLSLGAIAQERRSLPVYAWSEESSMARIPKELLREVSLPAVQTKEWETGELGLTERFIDFFDLSPVEVQQISKALAEALHEFRVAAQERLKPITTVEMPAPRYTLTAKYARLEPGDTLYRFELTPFPDVAEAIRTKLAREVLSAIGAERAEFFWQNAEMLDHQIPTFPEAPEAPWSREKALSYAFVFPPKGKGVVMLYYIERSKRGGGSEGVVFGEGLDRYAPETLKPVLEEWRAAAMKAGVKPPAVEPTSGPPPDQNQMASAIWKAAKGNKEVPYADVPKSLLSTLNIPGLTVDETLTPEIAALLGLTEDDQRAVMALYAEMKGKCELIERANFSRVEAGEGNFILKPFPNERAALLNEWTVKLKQLMGAKRGIYLDQALRAFPSRKRDRANPMKAQQPFHLNQSWLHRGTDVIRMQINPEIGDDGQKRIRIKYEAHPSGRQGSGSFREVPARWKHLITPEMLSPPQELG